jgi:6-pyruvoyltetrahydropterin/6-carboxytetrahydropterin synthase
MNDSATMRVTRRYRFTAAHRLDTPAMTPEENRALYGKCNNPFGHGHDYVIDISVEGAVGEDGQVVAREAMDRLVNDAVILKLDHKNLNVDLPEFVSSVPTTENLASVIQNFLRLDWNLPAKLAAVRISETDRNTFMWEAGAA